MGYFKYDMSLTLDKENKQTKTLISAEINQINSLPINPLTFIYTEGSGLSIIETRYLNLDINKDFDMLKFLKTFHLFLPKFLY